MITTFNTSKIKQKHVLESTFSDLSLETAIVLEMMVGVARVSDLTILWALLGIFAALPTVMAHSGKEPRSPPATRASRRSNRVESFSQPRSMANLGALLRLALVAWLIGGIGILIWVKNVNYVRASIQAGNAVEHFRTSNFQASLSSLDSAIDLAPDIPSYYNYRAQVYFAYQVFDQVTPEEDCSKQTEIPYAGCLNVKSFESNLQGVGSRPFYYRSRSALANSALNLKQDELAFRLYNQVLSMVPNSMPMRQEVGSIYINLARAYLDANQPKLALEPLHQLITMQEDIKDSGGNLYSSYTIMQVLFLQGEAYTGLSRLPEAVDSYERALQPGIPEHLRGRTHKALGEVYQELGDSLSAQEHLSIVNGMVEELFERSELHLLKAQVGPRYQRAATELELAVELTSDDFLKAQAHQQLSMLYSSLGKTNLSEQHQNAIHGLAEQWFQRGISQTGNAQATIGSPGELSLDPESAATLRQYPNTSQKLLKALLLRGDVLRDLGRLPEAADSIEALLELPLPKDSLVQTRAHEALAEIYSELDQTQVGETRLAEELIASPPLR